MKVVAARFVAGKVSSNDPLAYDLCETRKFGERSSSVVVYMAHEAVFLVEQGLLRVVDSKDSVLSKDVLLKKFSSKQRGFLVEYLVFRNLRKKGYVVKTALKFGATFRVYDKGVDIKKAHAKWIVFPVAMQEKIGWQEFCAKNRIAHSTKKMLLIAVVDEESDISYYSVEWLRP